ncbi:hypothetical protein AVEN_33107-1 [Araneus ventricosus]|uniref:Mos1 transposase HTH domain-containing protein n=1 Tax=Araneus ventricosus TaxID=182803 RepID=A0A4Y2CVT2_ARAVE|nr:hypothetical protein AVEN_33107-1 [Araneus ventricosus]
MQFEDTRPIDARNFVRHAIVRPHTARLRGEKTGEFWRQLLQHSPYNPELAPRIITFLVCLNCKRFATCADAEQEVHKRLIQQSRDCFAAGTGKLINRWDK